MSIKGDRMHFIYIDDSGEDNTALFTAITVSTDVWNDVFKKMKEFRKSLKIRYGIPTNYELHASKFTAGRGNPSSRIITKYERSIIFKETLDLIAGISDFSIFNVIGKKVLKMLLFERLLNRLDRTLKDWDSSGFLICDKGDEYDITRLVRRMHVWNPIPSNHGIWQETKKAYKNIPLIQIIEDPVFKPSEASYFIQFCDFCAYALLRKEIPLTSKNNYGYNTFFDCLQPRLVKVVNPKDPDGIIRV